MSQAIKLVIIAIVCAQLASCSLVRQSPSKKIKLTTLDEITQPQKLDYCNICVQFADQALETLLNAILNLGIVGGCGDLCSYVEEKLDNKVLGAVCNVVCDVVGIDEFVKLINKADLDPIYYCELVQLCPIMDYGDAKITSFDVTPKSGSQGTTFTISLNYSSKNGTGTGEVYLGIRTVDGIPLSDGFLQTPKPPGNYQQVFQVKAEPDPDCDPTQGPCEEWLPGTYSVDIYLCNGECGSRHPHSKIYDQATTEFTLTD